ncbi:MAG TPA: glycosyltransferase family 4 protein [Steroidobacteraceae bacterium]|nr:glycosyltransferase family 4 protein [Steroidobacteraceae bacterium]
MKARSLILMKWPTNVGYAIGALEKLFYETALELGEGDASAVHFGYTDTAPGRPATLPENFGSYHTFDINHPTPDMLAKLRELVTRERIDFAMPFDIQPAHPMFKVMRAAGVRTIVPYWGAPISGVSPPWKRLLKRALLAADSSRADGLIFESQAMADLAILGRGVPADRVDVVYLGVDTEKFQPDRDSDYVHSALGIPKDRKVFVFTGHCTQRKGIRTLIDAAIEVLHKRGRTDVCFLLCGNSGDESKPYEALYEHLPIAPWIRFLGYRRDVVQIFQSAYCGVIPSSGWDSFTLSSVEMSACGLPIIASRLQGLAEAVLHEKTGLNFEPGNSQALADCIERMADNPALARAFGAAGRQRAVCELTLAKQKAGLLRAIRRRLPAAPG